MFAAFYSRTGAAHEVLEVGELATPEPAPGEVRVRLHASGINPTDIKRRAGAPGRTMSGDTIIPHNDGAGVIDSVGDGVTLERIGQRVWVFSAQFQRSQGTAAQYVTIPEALAVDLPDEADLSAGACLGIPAVTAYFTMTSSNPEAENWVFVSGGAGAVGHYAVQIAKLNGSSVIASVSSQEKADHATAAGADHTIDYTREDVVARVAEITDGTGVDRFVDVNLNANAPLLPGLMRPGGRIVSYSSTDLQAEIPVRDLRLKNITMQFLNINTLSLESRRPAHAKLNTWLKDKRLIHAIRASYPLNRIADAHVDLENGNLMGNAVLILP